MKYFCQSCKLPLVRKDKCFSCSSCGVRYESFLDIPIFRRPDEESLSKDDDEIAEKLAKLYYRMDFTELYKTRTDIVLNKKGPREREALEKKFRGYDDQFLKNRMTVGDLYFQRVISKLGELRLDLPGNRTAIDIGCGIGPGLLCLSRVFERVYGVDIRLSYLVLAKKFLEENSIKNVLLLWANAEELPLPDELCDYGQAIAVIEHVKHSGNFVKDCARVTKQSGIFVFSSNNRYSVLTEPHSKIPLFGYFPKKMTKYISSILPGDPMADVSLLSYFDLRNILRENFPNKVVMYALPPKIIFMEDNTLFKKIIKKLSESEWLSGILNKILNNVFALLITPIHHALCIK